PCHVQDAEFLLPEIAGPVHGTGRLVLRRGVPREVRGEACPLVLHSVDHDRLLGLRVVVEAARLQGRLQTLVVHGLPLGTRNSACGPTWTVRSRLIVSPNDESSPRQRAAVQRPGRCTLLLLQRPQAVPPLLSSVPPLPYHFAV